MDLIYFNLLLTCTCHLVYVLSNKIMQILNEKYLEVGVGDFYRKHLNQDDLFFFSLKICTASNMILMDSSNFLIRFEIWIALKKV